MKTETVNLPSSGLEAVQARFALRVAGHLNECEISHDVAERLKAARELALERARLVRRAEAASGVQLNGVGSLATMVFGGGPGSSRWFKLASLLPILALVAGFIVIDRLHVKAQIAAAAEIDAALLADDLPPTAYTDPGFLEYLKVPRN